MLAQLGRDSENRRPALADFQYSSQIEQDGDVVLMLWHYVDKEEIQEGKHTRTIDHPKSAIIVGKARDGKTGDIPVRFEKSILTFYEIEQKEK
jgi:replicative DNA helicase